MTAQELINQALRKIGVIASGETPSTEESNDAFVALNQLLDSWSARKVPVLGLTPDSVTMTGATSYALSPRPLKIKSARLLVAGIVVPFDVVSAEAFAANPPRSLMYDNGFSTGTIYPTLPAPTSGTLELQTYVPLTAIASLATSISLPPGYERALVSALAMDLAPEYGRPVPAELQGTGTEAIDAIASLNAEVLGEGAPAAPPAVAA